MATKTRKMELIDEIVNRTSEGFDEATYREALNQYSEELLAYALDTLNR